MQNMMPVFQEWHILRATSKPSVDDRQLTFSSTVPKRIAVHIHEARIKKRMTLFDVAGRIGKDPHTIALYENGLETPDASVAKKLEDCLGIALP